ncbi:MAG: ATP-dependent helicase [Acidobacteria bacterium]|nr:MAG: ATP-dependent helicase [Acidobacteriota bacterium]
MVILHGVWASVSQYGPGLVLWAEEKALFDRVQQFAPISDFFPRLAKHLEGKAQPEWHPFAVSGNALRKIVQDTMESSTKRKRIPQVFLDLELPTQNDNPIFNCSSWLSDQQARVFTQPWRTPAIHLSPEITLTWLIFENWHKLNTEDDESLMFWRKACLLALYSLIHGTYRPFLFDNELGIQTKWQIDAATLNNQIQSLAERMPQGCLSHWHPRLGKKSRETALKTFLDNMIDHIIRVFPGPLFFANLPARRKKKTNPLDQLARPFLKSLLFSQNAISAPRDLQNAFVALVSNWLQPVTGASKPWQLCFTLIPPEIGTARIDDLDPKMKLWRLAFSLQSSRDASNHIFAGEIWDLSVPIEMSSGKTLAELLMRDLGRALNHYPKLREALHQPYPEYIDLTTEEAYKFLSEQSHHLTTAGFSVCYPDWWKKNKKKLKTKLKLDGGVFDKNSMMGFDTMVKFSWQAAVGDKKMTHSEFKKLVDNQLTLLPIDGQWVEISQEDLFSAVNFFSENPAKGEMRLLDAFQMGIEGSELETSEDQDIDFRGALTEIFARNNQSFPDITPPETLNGTLRPYQKRGLSWLVFHQRLGFGCCLADDMGLGKTVQLLALLLQEREEKKGKFHSKPTLLICPMSVVGNWYREAKKFAPSLQIMIHHGNSRLVEDDFINRHRHYDLILTTYQLANRDKETLNKIKWHRIALDEAQNIKNPATQQTQAIQSFACKHAIALTGTPVENKLAELWSIMEFLNPGYLGSLKTFQNRFATPIEKQQNKEKAQLLRKITQPFILRRLKTDQTIIKDLPEKNEFKVYCDLTDEQASIYQAYVNQKLNEIENASQRERSQLVLTTLTKLKQICNHPAHFLKDHSEIRGRSGKLMRLTEMLEEALEEGDKSLIFTQYSEMGTILESYLGETFHQETLFLHGGIPQKKRQEMVDHFQSEDGPGIFILTVKTGGTGLNLTAASHVFHYDRWWNPAVENQATDRAFRIGQTKNVQVHKMIAIGTLEDRIDALIEKKKDLADHVVTGDESWLNDLSTDNLREIMSLSFDDGFKI